MPPTHSHLLSGELHAEPRYDSRLLEDTLRRNREKNFVILPSAARCRRSPFSVAFPNGARSISSPNAGNYGREQAVAVGKQCKRCRRVRLWQDTHCSRKHVGS